MKEALRQFWARKDVLFSLGGMIVGSLLLYADRLPLWGLVLLVVMRETFGFIGMHVQQQKQQVPP